MGVDLWEAIKMKARADTPNFLAAVERMICRMPRLTGMRATWLLVQSLIWTGCWQDPALPSPKGLLSADATQEDCADAPIPIAEAAEDMTEDPQLEGAITDGVPDGEPEADVPDNEYPDTAKDAPKDHAPYKDTETVETDACGSQGDSCYGSDCCQGLICDGWKCRHVDATSEPIPCELQKLGEGCEYGVVGWLECCPDLVCQQGRCVDPDSGTDGATACTCGCTQVFGSDGGLQEIDCTHGGCGCQNSGPVQEFASTLCPPLWVCYGPGQGEVCSSPWMPIYEDNSTGGSCKGANHVRCAPCYTWKPC